ncbi:39S ribosomal protein L54, mitochondrial [Eurytemora carolleeae]|uniref:39S ribosomal protein L54, mitochondrial n=1 Tax=Eurytemora carolleeae TaxID=1294199 RepID=UPI000C77D126|nr:39S ribosomal protein L54, mitochondrial [Eurytemora carolleeae]|eukprot:XP_023329489.1 39S ribosomal protein L54, mitochondrial-like [Eurytemora affinis]
MLGIFRCTSKQLILNTSIYSQVPVRGAKAKAAKGKGGKSAKPVLEVETDAKKLVSQVCGLNYALEGPLSEPVLIKPDSEYPDWLFKLDIKRPKPTLDELDPNTREYWEEVQKLMDYKRIRLLKLKLK